MANRKSGTNAWPAPVERREVPTENYLLDHPLLVEHWLDGMERLGLGGLGGGAERR
jgi:hypothetical protein